MWWVIHEGNWPWGFGLAGGRWSDGERDREGESTVKLGEGGDWELYLLFKHRIWSEIWWPVENEFFGTPLEIKTLGGL